MNRSQRKQFWDEMLRDLPVAPRPYRLYVHPSLEEDMKRLMEEANKDEKQT